jgi:hypothetical protein
VNAGLAWTRSGATDLMAGVDGGAALTDERGDWISGYAGMWVRRSLTDRLSGGLTLEGRAFEVREPDRYDAVELRAEPELLGRWGGGGWSIRGIGRLAAVSWGPEGADSRTDVWTAGAGVTLHHVVGRVRVELDGQIQHSDPGAWKGLGLSATAPLGPGPGVGTVRLDLRAWDTPVEEGQGSAVLSVALPLGGALRTFAAGGRSDPDPLLGTPAAGYATVGVSVDAVRLLDPPAPPVVRVLGAPSTEGRRVRFTVRPGAAGAVEVLGDFSAWQAVPLRRAGETWSVEVELEPGLYHFGFRVDGRWWVPESTPGSGEDEWGRPTGTVVVPSA